MRPHLRLWGCPSYSRSLLHGSGPSHAPVRFCYQVDYAHGLRSDLDRCGASGSDSHDSAERLCGPRNDRATARDGCSPDSGGVGGGVGGFPEDTPSDTPQ